MRRWILSPVPSLVLWLALGIIPLPLTVDAQAPARVHRIGILAEGSPPNRSTPWPVFRALRDLGYVEGRNLVFERRYAEGKLDRLAAFAAELVRLKVDLVLTTGAPATRAAKQATATIPIVFVLNADPVESGLVASLARPGGNLTGFTWGDLDEKRVEVLKEAVPGLSRVAVLQDANYPPYSSILSALRVLDAQAQFLDVRSPGEIDGAVAAAVSGRAGALLVLDSPLFFGHSRRIADLALKGRLPAMAQFRTFAEAGGLLSYGPKPEQAGPRVAAQVDRILKGAPPGDIPVEQPTVFELVVNQKTARALGLTIPQSVLLRADQVLQ